MVGRSPAHPTEGGETVLRQRRLAWTGALLALAATAGLSECRAGEDEAALRKAVIEAAKGRKRITFYIDMMGRPARARLRDADAEGVEISVRGMTTPLAWEKMAPVRFAGLAKRCVGGDAKLLLALARYCAGQGLGKEAESALEAARKAGASAEEIKKVSSNLASARGNGAGRPANQAVKTNGGTGVSGAELVGISVEDHSGVARRNWPVTGGIPFPKGKVKDVARVGLVGRPSQARVLSRWSDGSVKWALLDYQTDLPPKGRAKDKVVLSGARVAAAAGNSVSDGGSITVDTGAIKFSVSKSRFEFISEAWVDLDGDGSYAESERVIRRGGQDHFYDLQVEPPKRDASPYRARNLLTGESRPVKQSNPRVRGGSRWISAAPKDARTSRVSAKGGSYSAQVVEHGPMRTVVRLKGTFGGGGDSNQYTIWIHAYRGKPFLRIQHNFVFRGDPQKEFFRRMGLALPLAFDGPPKFSAAGAGGVSQLGARENAYLFSTGPHDVFHLEHKGFGLDWEAGAGKGAPKRGREKTAGWIDVTGARFGMTASFRDMAYKYPKELSYDAKAKALTAWIWPDHGDLVLDMRASGYPDGMQGVSFSHDVLLNFHGPGEAGRAAATAAALDDPLEPYANPEWYSYRGTKAAGMIMPHDDKQFPKAEAVLATRTAFIERAMTEWGWLGMLNYGDHLWAYRYNDSGRTLGTWGMGGSGDHYDGWRRGNTMVTYRMQMQYLRTGEYRYRRAAHAHLTFLRDALIKHHSSTNPKHNGVGRRHSAYWGATKGNDRTGGTAMDGYGTNWLGHYLHWNLTGDWRTHEVIGELRGCFTRLGNTVLNQPSGGAYVALKLFGGIPGHEACLGEAGGFLKMAVERTSKPGDYWRDCTWWFGYGLYLQDSNDDTIRQAILDFWKRCRHGQDNYRMYWQRDSASAVYWAAEGNEAVRKACYEELLKYGNSEVAGDRRVPMQHAFYQQHGVRGCFTSDMQSLEKVVAHSVWRAKDDILQQQWGEPLSLAVIDHYRRSSK